MSEEFFKEFFPAIYKGMLITIIFYTYTKGCEQIADDLNNCLSSTVDYNKSSTYNLQLFKEKCSKQMDEYNRCSEYKAKKKTD